LSVFRGIFLEFVSFLVELTDLLLKEVLVEDFISDERAPEFGGFS